MFVAASTDCFPDLPLMDAIERLVDLEYSNVVIAVRESGCQIRPSEVAQDVEKAASFCCNTHRLNILGYTLEIEATGEEYLRQFTACCRLAKATKVVQLTIPSAELGTPFNEEVEDLRKRVQIASLEGVLVGIKTETGRLSEDSGTVGVLCDNVKGLGVTLDPSHFVWGRPTMRNYEPILKYVNHVQLRDSNKDHLQVRIGQGCVEFGKLVTQLQRFDYRRVLEVNLAPAEGIDHSSEMRKMRLLLESLL